MGIPSTINMGWLVVFRELVPRSRVTAPLPGSPERLVTCIPGVRPCMN